MPKQRPQPLDISCTLSRGYVNITKFDYHVNFVISIRCLREDFRKESATLHQKEKTSRMSACWPYAPHIKLDTVF